MATGLRDEIKTMRGRRQEAGRALNDRPDRWIALSLSLFLPLEARHRKGRLEQGGQREGERGEGRGGGGGGGRKAKQL